MNKPKQVIIFGICYEIIYVDKPSEVDIFHRESLWGQIDYWTRTIRIYDKGRATEDIWETILHEVLHGIAETLNIKCLQDKDAHDDLDVLALALNDTLWRNQWFRLDAE